MTGNTIRNPTFSAIGLFLLQGAVGIQALVLAQPSKPKGESPKATVQTPSPRANPQDRPLSGPRPRYFQGAVPSGKDPLGPTFLGHDVRVLVAEIDRTIAARPKSEFETSAQYKSRLNSFHAQDWRRVTVLPIEEDSPDRLYYNSQGRVRFQYDADRQIMTGRIEPSANAGLLNDNSNAKQGFRLQKDCLAAGHYVGSNSFGTSALVKKIACKEYILTFERSSELFEKTESYSENVVAKLEIPMAPQEAMSQKASLRVALVFRVSDATVHRRNFLTKPTIADPYETAELHRFLVVDPEELWVFDFRTGRIITRVGGETKAKPDPLPVMLSDPPPMSGNSGIAGGFNGGGPGTIGGMIESIPTAAPPPKRIRVGANTQAANIGKMVRPTYPKPAKQARIQGTVRFNAVIAKDGAIQSLQVVSGHPLLIPAATEAVRQWIYRPTQLNGESVEVQTQIDVNFTLSN